MTLADNADQAPPDRGRRLSTETFTACSDGIFVILILGFSAAARPGSQHGLRPPWTPARRRGSRHLSGGRGGGRAGICVRNRLKVRSAVLLAEARTHASAGLDQAG
jgi:hypothetical protein